MDTRLGWIDAAKGIGILGVVAAHTQGLWYGIGYLYTYNALVCISIFFLISGYLFNVEKYIHSITLFIKTRFNQLIIPLFSFVIISLVMQYVYFRFTGVILTKAFWNFDLFTLISGVLSINTYYMFRFTSLWFLAALFVCEIVFYFLLKITDNPFCLGAIITLCSVPVLIFYHNLFSPFWFAPGIVAMGLYFMGYVYKKYNISKKINSYILLILLLIFAIIGFQRESHMGISLLAWKNIYYWYIGTFTGTSLVFFGMFILYKYNLKSKILEYFGKNSLLIMILNIFIVFALKDILSFFNLSVFGPIITFLLALCFFAVTIPIVNKYIPWIVGKGKFFIGNPSINIQGKS